MSGARGFGSDFSYYYDRDKAYAVWVADHHDDAASILEALWVHRRARDNILWDHGEGPAWLLLAALAPTDPELVSTIWRGSLDDSGSMWIPLIEFSPARLPLGTAFDDLRIDA